MESATTELVRLPGLEAAVSETEPKPGHWLEHLDANLGLRFWLTAATG